jgi:hypothetical protein
LTIPLNKLPCLPKDVNGGLSTEPTLAKVSHRLATNGNSKNDNNKLENGQESNSVETTLNVKISNERFGKPRDSVGFSIMVGAFYDCIIPEDVESLWGPIPLQKLPPGVDNSCRAVTHG